jgi:hypothetical protein
MVASMAYLHRVDLVVNGDLVVVHLDRVNLANDDLVAYEEFDDFLVDQLLKTLAL